MQGNGNSYPAPVFLENTRKTEYNTVSSKSKVVEAALNIESKEPILEG